MLIPPHKYRYITLEGEFICYTVIAVGKLLKANFSRLNYVKLFITTRCECSVPVYLQINAFRLVLLQMQQLAGSILGARFVEQTPLQFFSSPGICVMFSVCLQRACVNCKKLLQANTCSELSEMTQGHVTQTSVEGGKCMMFRVRWSPKEDTGC